MYEHVLLILDEYLIREPVADAMGSRLMRTVVSARVKEDNGFRMVAEPRV